MFETQSKLIEIMVSQDHVPRLELNDYLDLKWNGRVRDLVKIEFCLRIWNKIKSEKLKKFLLDRQIICDEIEPSRNKIWELDREILEDTSFIEEYPRGSQENLIKLVQQFFAAGGYRNLPTTGELLEFYDNLEQEKIYQAKLIYSTLNNSNKFNINWCSETVVNLANQIYKNKQWELMPILADALQDEGCDQPILSHMRDSESRFCRGCWILDKILDKR